ncbi:MAG: response regulator [Verrucomicrobia bacterium]|nr:response regulator [Deltaproteobacteria bacterium]
MTKKQKVLVVDDDRRMVKTICDILRVKGHDPHPAYCGEEAVLKAGEELFDCVLMDLKMPGIDGVEALKRIREVAPDLPVVLMSANASENQAEEASRHGAYAVLTKPIDLQIVLSFLALLRKEESILIVDDDPMFCRTLKDILLERGYRVETEADPDSVMGHLEVDYKLLVVLDLKLGQAEGVDVLKEIRRKYPSKPVVLVTGHHGESMASIEKALRIGAYTCLYKPLEIEKLVAIIEDTSRGKLRDLLREPY